MAKDDGTGKKRRKPAATDRAEGPVAKRRAQDTQRTKPRRSSAEADASEKDKRKDVKKSSGELMCSVCPDKPARDHLRPGEHCEGTEY